MHSASPPRRSSRAAARLLALATVLATAQATTPLAAQYPQAPPARHNAAVAGANFRPAGDARGFSEPIRITQLADQAPGPSPPATAPSGPSAPPSAPPFAPAGQPIVPAVPPPADSSSERREGDFRVPFQHRLPPELIMDPPTPDEQRQFERFVPKIVDPQDTLNLIVGHPRILTFADWAVKPQVRIYLPDEQIARWDIISDTEVAIVGLRPGTTVLTLWFHDPTAPQGQRVLSYRVRVYEDPVFRESLAEIENQINRLFPNSHVELSIVRDRLVVKGQAHDAIEAAQILSVLAQTRDESQGGRYQNERVSTTQVFIGQDMYAQQDTAALRRSLLNPNSLIESGIVNLLRIPGEQQVMLRVTVAEINRSALRSIGADVQIGSGDVTFLSLVANNSFLPVPGEGNLLVNTPDFRLALSALRRVNLARTLAEPNLVALNGRSATFFAGDRVPLPVATAGFGGVGQSVAFDNVGVTLTFTPHIVDRDRIRLEVAGNVSSLDNAQPQTNIGGSNVSTRNARSFQTTVDLRDGETMAMAGLILNTMRSEAARVPLAGDLPLIGTIFSDKSNVYTEQELVVLVTPELAHPLEACQTPPVPGADVFEPSDVEFYLGNRLESRRSQDYRSSIRTDWHRIVAGEKSHYAPVIIGPSGHSYGCCPPRPAPAFAPPPAPAPIVPEIVPPGTGSPRGVSPEAIPTPAPILELGGR